MSVDVEFGTGILSVTEIFKDVARVAVGAAVVVGVGAAGFVGLQYLDTTHRQAAETATAAATLINDGGEPSRIVVGKDGKVLCYQTPAMLAPSCQ